MESKILLIRHGITEGNQKKWYYGSTDLPLTEEGIETLKDLSAQGKYPDVAEDAKFFTTGLIRTEQTLKYIYGDREHGVIDNLREMNFGEYECRSFGDVETDPVFLEWGYDTTGDVSLPGAETQNQFKARVSEGLKELINQHRLNEFSHRHSGNPAHTVMVCHGGVISGIMHAVFPDPDKTIWDWMPDPGNGYILTASKGEILDFKKLID